MVEIKDTYIINVQRVRRSNVKQGMRASDLTRWAAMGQL